MVISENLTQTVKDNMGHFLDCAFEGKISFGPIEVMPGLTMTAKKISLSS